MSCCPDQPMPPREDERRRIGRAPEQGPPVGRFRRAENERRLPVVRLCWQAHVREVDAPVDARREGER